MMLNDLRSHSHGRVRICKWTKSQHTKHSNMESNHWNRCFFGCFFPLNLTSDSGTKKEFNDCILGYIPWSTFLICQLSISYIVFCVNQNPFYFYSQNFLTCSGGNNSDDGLGFLEGFCMINNTKPKPSSTKSFWEGNATYQGSKNVWMLILRISKFIEKKQTKICITSWKDVNFCAPGYEVMDPKNRLCRLFCNCLVRVSSVCPWNTCHWSRWIQYRNSFALPMLVGFTTYSPLGLSRHEVREVRSRSRWAEV